MVYEWREEIIALSELGNEGQLLMILFASAS
jgi:hypothetical protein